MDPNTIIHNTIIIQKKLALIPPLTSMNRSLRQKSRKYILNDKQNKEDVIDICIIQTNII